MMKQTTDDELELQVGVAKVSKYAVSESGDTLEVTERPHGGLSLVLADGQQSGRAAKVISSLVARKAITLLAEGVRDGAAARATHDYLRTNWPSCHWTSRRGHWWCLAILIARP